MSNKRMWLDGMVDLGSKVIGPESNTNSEKSTFGSKVGFGSRVESKSKNWNSHSFLIHGMLLSKFDDSIPISMGIRINVGSEN